MKATQKDFARGIPSSAREASVFFFCGPDEAGASAAADAVIAALGDAGERIDLPGAELRRDPARLGDEARSVSLFGGSRHIHARANGDEAHDALKALIETGAVGAGAAAPVFVIATGATDKSRSAKLLANRPDALVAMFYPPDLASITASVRALGDAAGLRLGGDLAERIARAAGLDIRLARSEVEKLALYLNASPQAPKPAQPADFAAIGASTEEDGFAPVIDTVLSGALDRLGSELARIRDLGLNPVGLVLALERRAVQLARIRTRVGPHGRMQTLGRGEKAQLGIFWKDEAVIERQLVHWDADRLSRLGKRCVAVHRRLLADNRAAELMITHELAEIARYAAKRS